MIIDVELSPDSTTILNPQLLDLLQELPVEIKTGNEASKKNKKCKK
jgi:hypothetical protein